MASARAHKTQWQAWGRAACAVMVLLGASAVEARAQAFVTGSANTDGFAIVGWLHDNGDGTAKGAFSIVVHRDLPEHDITGSICSYRYFDEVVFEKGFVRFHSIGVCQGLLTNGTQLRFLSDNVFGIRDNGQPGAGLDTIDVNYLGASGVAVPGGALVDGNFVVSR